MSHVKSRKHAAVPGALGLLIAATPLYAQPVAPAPAAAASSASSSASTLPAIRAVGKTENDYKSDTVSSPKFTQPLVDTPQTITVIKKELLQQQQATTLSEALRNTPGITMLMGENGNTTTGDSIFMRGFDTSGSIFVDGIRDLGTFTRDTFNLEQIEVVKGPAGTDNGRGSPTGYINLVTKVPSLEEAGSAGIALGSGSRKRVTADLNRPLDIGIPGSAVRLNVMGQDFGGIDRDVVQYKSWGIAPSIAVGLGTPTRAYLYLLHTRQNNTPDGGIPTIGMPGYYNAAFDPTAFPGDAGDTAVRPAVTATRGIAGRAGVTDPARVDLSNYYGSKDDYDHVEANMLTARIEHDIAPGMTIRNTSRYGRATQRYELTGIVGVAVPVATPGNVDTYTVARSRQAKDQENEILTNQTSLTAKFATGPVKHSLSTGVEVIHERQSNVGYAMRAGSSQQAANLYHPSTGDVFQPLVATGAYTKGTTTTLGVYAFDTLEFNEQWLFSAGARVDRYRTEYLGLPAASATPTTATSLSSTDTLLTGKFGLVYKPVANGSVYVSFASSQKPPGSDAFTLAAPPTTTTGAPASSSINNPNLDPQKATNVELGTKWDVMDNRLALTAAVYRTVNKNDQSDRDPVTGNITQYGEKRVQGIELGAVGQLTPAWQLSAGVATMDTEVTQGSRLSTTQGGAAINWSPKLTFTSWTTYRFPFGLTVGGGARYVDSQSRQINNAVTNVTNLPEVPSYWVGDLMASYEVSRNVSIQLNVYNVTDKFYIASLNNGGNRIVLGTPRSALLSANFRF